MLDIEINCFSKIKIFKMNIQVIPAHNFIKMV